MTSLLNIFWLGLKELRSLGSDLVMMFFVAYAFTGTIYVQATGTSSEVNNASIALVDENNSALSKELINAFYPPRFQTPETIAAADVETTMDEGRFMFVVVIPPRFEPTFDRSSSGHPVEHRRNCHAAGRHWRGLHKKHHQRAHLQFFQARGRLGVRPCQSSRLPAFNPNGEASWFASVVGIINQVTLLTVILTGAAVIREREHGTLEHLLVMPLTAFEIAMAKVWANSLVI